MRGAQLKGLAAWRPISHLKSAVVRPGSRPRRVLSGAFRGLRMWLDLRSQSQVYLGLAERELFGPLSRASQAALTAIDIGAGEGEYTLYFLAKTGPKAVLSFEPSDRARVRLEENLKLNGLMDTPRLMLSARFVASYDDNDHCTLDSLAGTLEPPAIVKVDIDGGEADVLRGAGSLLRSSHVSWIIETHSVTLEQDCIGILRSAGLNTRIVPNAWWRVMLPELRVVSQNRWLLASRDVKVFG